MNSSLSIGVLSGTSMDGIDVVLADFSATFPQIIATNSHPYPDQLRNELMRLARGTDTGYGLDSLLELHYQVAEIFTAAILALLDQSNTLAENVACIGFHGQTIAHRPLADPPWTLQLGDPGKLSKLTRITVVSDFRTTDIAAGGQGAPLAPLIHQQLFQSDKQPTAVVNIGGIANITQADGSGYDTGPGNCLLDAWIRLRQQQKFDQNGKWASKGQVQKQLVDAWLADDYFQAKAPKSTGTDYFNLDWLSQTCDLNHYQAEDIQASLAELTARSIAVAISHDTERLLLCGGGVHNTDLLERLQQQLIGIEVSSTASAGVDPDWVEGLLFAWLGWQRIHNIKVDTSKITGACKPILAGAIYHPNPQIEV